MKNEQDSCTTPDKPVSSGRELTGVKQVIEQIIEEGQFITVENILRMTDQSQDEDGLYTELNVKRLLQDLERLQDDVTNAKVRILLARATKGK